MKSAAWRFFLWIFCSLGLLLATNGCAWESSNNEPDANQADGSDVGYPPPPYGTEYGDTVEDFRVDEVLCGAGTYNHRALYASDYLGNPATLFSVHAGWCTFCKQQATTMEESLYQPYKDQGLKIVLVIFEDEQRNSDFQTLLEYACSYRERYGMTFTIAIDPGAQVMGRFFRPNEGGTPLNMLLDRDMVIRYKLEGLIPDTLEGNIESLLNEH